MVAGKVKKPGKRGRKPAKIDLKAKLERSRQSARECRARKKLRYQYLEELVSSKERAICALREEMDMVNTHTHSIRGVLCDTPGVYLRVSEGINSAFGSRNGGNSQGTSVTYSLNTLCSGVGSVSGFVYFSACVTF